MLNWSLPPPVSLQDQTRPPSTAQQEAAGQTALVKEPLEVPQELKYLKYLKYPLVQLVSFVPPVPRVTTEARRYYTILDTMISSVLRPSRWISEMGWTGELWLKTKFLILEN